MPVEEQITGQATVQRKADSYRKRPVKQSNPDIPDAYGCSVAHDGKYGLPNRVQFAKLKRILNG